jgi:hypothetical protein
MNIYAHAIAVNDRTAADTIGSTVFGKKGEEDSDYARPERDQRTAGKPRIGSRQKEIQRLFFK